MRSTRPTRYTFAFDHDHEQDQGRSPRDLVDQLGGKGANLAEMAAVLGLPVPPGFTITTEACRAYQRDGVAVWDAGLADQVDEHLVGLERTMRRRLGDPEDPLLVSVRSGARHSMPGMMDTVLNLGLNEASVEGLARATGDRRFAYDAYCRFIGMYARIVLGLDDPQFDERPTDAGAAGWQDLAGRLLAVVEAASGEPFPQDPHTQLRGAVQAVFASWDTPRARAYRARENIPQDLGTAVNVQTMVFGNRDDRSGTGVAFTRDAATGEDRPYGDFLANAQGEDVVAGVRATDDLTTLGRQFPEAEQELLTILARLEAHYRDMCDTEFTIEQGKLWMLQTRVGKRTGRAAVRMAVDMVRQAEGERGWSISREEALERVQAEQVEQLLHPQFADDNLDVLLSGLAASPGAAVGQACFSADQAVAAAGEGQPVILVRDETSPEDIHGMQVAEGILTARGGLVSHAAVVARSWGIPAVVGADALHIDGDEFSVNGVAVRAGDTISLDGTAGHVVMGEAALSASAVPDELDTLLRWADELAAGRNRGGYRLQVRANADTGPDAARAREFGARGIGLCRTEHMFFGEDRLPVVREMILAEGADAEAAALDRLREAQRHDFVEVLEAMDGLPVTVRLLDPPLHEFLPRVSDLRAEQADDTAHDDTAHDDTAHEDTAHEDEEQRRQLLAAAESWQEANPMLGVRGVRLAVLKPGLYAMQVRALMEAVAERRRQGGDPSVEVMIPLTVSGPEMAAARRWVEDAVAASNGEQVAVGTMVETPRASLRAAELAEASDFFSFGTNDLTQMTFGFSRDDVAGKLLPAYLDQGLLDSDPFASVDVAAVGELISLGVARGRSAHPELTVGVCGEHGGDPASIRFFLTAGVDYVSCSPYRVPVARLAAAQAILAQIRSGSVATTQ